MKNTKKIFTTLFGSLLFLSPLIANASNLNKSVYGFSNIISSEEIKEEAINKNTEILAKHRKKKKKSRKKPKKADFSKIEKKRENKVLNPNEKKDLQLRLKDLKENLKEKKKNFETWKKIISTDKKPDKREIMDRVMEIKKLEDQIRNIEKKLR